jgi:caffeoyl-CoA O-methyltransferase
MTPPAARRRSQFIDAVIDDYAAAHSTPPDTHQLELQRITQEKTGRAAGMQIGDDQAVLMEMLVRAMGATRAVEIGTFTGYSALAVARGLGPGGRLLCCDISQEWTSIARAAWQEAGVANRIELRLGPGLETLRSLPPGEQFDFAFIDADKTGYAQYYEEVLTRLRPGGLILLDNTLQGGHVVSDLPDNEDVAAIRSLNDAIAGDPRVKVVLIPIGDGVSLVQKHGRLCIAAHKRVRRQRSLIGMCGSGWRDWQITATTVEGCQPVRRGRALVSRTVSWGVGGRGCGCR